MSIIKNVPPHTFGIAGNRGMSFPAAVDCAKLQQPFIQLDDVECWLVKEEDGYTCIYTDRNYVIGVDCKTPIQAPCYIILQESTEDDEMLLIAEEYTLEEDVFFCDSLPEEEITFICLQEDLSIPVIFDPYERQFQI